MVGGEGGRGRGKHKEGETNNDTQGVRRLTGVDLWREHGENTPDRWRAVVLCFVQNLGFPKSLYVRERGHAEPLRFQPPYLRT